MPSLARYKHLRLLHYFVEPLEMVIVRYQKFRLLQRETVRSDIAIT